MRVWELVSAFRDEPEIIEDELSRPEWHAYTSLFSHFGQNVQERNRGVLDATLPDDLCHAVAAKSKKRFVLTDGGVLQRAEGPASLEAQPKEELSALQVFIRFGGACLEEVAEYGLCNVTEWKQCPSETELP